MTKKVKGLKVVYQGAAGDDVRLLDQPNKLGAAAIVLNPNHAPKLVMVDGKIQELKL